MLHLLGPPQIDADELGAILELAEEAAELLRGMVDDGAELAIELDVGSELEAELEASVLEITELDEGILELLEGAEDTSEPGAEEAEMTEEDFDD